MLFVECTWETWPFTHWEPLACVHEYSLLSASIKLAAKRVEEKEKNGEELEKDYGGTKKMPFLFKVPALPGVSLLVEHM